jgi:hypothetical protein
MLSVLPLIVTLLLQVSQLFFKLQVKKDFSTCIDQAFQSFFVHGMNYCREAAGMIVLFGLNISPRFSGTFMWPNKQTKIGYA